jgi:hypothetical protein
LTLEKTHEINTSLTSFVKLLRATGGCLGINRRRRTWLPAISSGELDTSFDPEISEWGNPMGLISHHYLSEYIGR